MTDNVTYIEEKTEKSGKVRFSPYLLWAFFVPAAILLTLYLIRGVYPIGENSVLVLDLNAQYVYFYEELRDVLLGDGSLLYSWQRALGGEFMGMFAYYLASPFNFIVALFSEAHITEALLTIFVLKAGLSGFNFAVYLHYSERAKNKIVTVIFSSMYALTSFGIVNGHNSMWIDVLLFLPLVILGLEKLINERKYKLYTIVLAVSVISNFYIGFMLCIFIAIYSVYYYFAYGYSDEYNKTGERFHLIQAFVRVLFFSVIAIAMSAVIIFTIYYSLKFGKNDFSDPNYTLTSNFNLLEFFAKLLPNSYDTVRPEGLPFVYCGILSLILVPLLFISRKISPREKICTGFVLSIMILLFSGSTLDIFMHGLQKPNWLNYRYSFMFCFLLVLLAHQAFNLIKDINYNHVVAVCGGLVLLIALVQAEEYEYIDSVLCIWISIICVGIYLLALYAVRKEKVTSFSALILAILVCTELLINGYINLDSLDKDVIFSSRTSYREYIDKMSPLTEYVQTIDDSFYRYEKTDHRRTNDNMTLDINGLSSSTSTLNASIIKLLNQLGYSSKSHWSKYLGGTPVSDSLLGIKYVISNDKLNEDIYTKLHSENGFTVYRNEYAQSVAFAASDLTEYVDFGAFASPFDLMNDLVTLMLGEIETIQLFKPITEISETNDNVSKTQATTLYTKYVPKKDSASAVITYSFTMPGDGPLYFFYPSDYPRKVNLTLNYQDWGTFFDNETDRIIALDEFEEGDNVNFKVTLKDENLYILTDENYFYYLDMEIFKEVMTKFNEQAFIVEEHSDTRLYGTINVKEDESILYTSIPYDKGWKVYCDGEELPLSPPLGDALLSVHIPKGEHTLELIYRPDCFVYGCIVAITGLMMFMAVVAIEYTIKHKKRVATEVSLNEAIYEPDLQGELTLPEESESSEDEQSPFYSDSDEKEQ